MSKNVFSIETKGVSTESHQPIQDLLTRGHHSQILARVAHSAQEWSQQHPRVPNKTEIQRDPRKKVKFHFLSLLTKRYMYYLQFHGLSSYSQGVQKFV